MFYLIPPRGFSTFFKLEYDVETRFKFLQKIMEMKGDKIKVEEDLGKNPNFCSNLDCLIEGSRRDCSSHFIFRLVCLHRGQMQNYWVTGETELFLYRIKSEDNLHEVITKFLIDIKKVLKFQNLTECHQKLLRQLYFLLYPIQDSDIVFCKKREGYCHFINVPWTYVEELVSHREVYVRKGFAKVPCSHFMNFLASIFKMLLFRGIEQLKELDMHIDDIRIIQLMKNIQSYYLKLNKYAKNSLVLTRKDIERKVRYFPLCMQQLHTKLKKSGRLNHNERFRYSLFLKDIGLPLEESILFWKNYYSETPKCCHTGCQHVWVGATGRKFEYGIRHIYGKEGKKINYSSHSCSILQALSPQPQESGGCPFMYLERSSLCDLISKNSRISQIQLEAILKACQNNNPSYACGLYLSGNLHEHSQNSNQLARFSSQLTNKKNRKTEKFKKSYSSFQHPTNKSFDNLMKNSCSGCRFNMINPEMSFMSPNVYFQLRNPKVVTSNKNELKNQDLLPRR